MVSEEIDNLKLFIKNPQFARVGDFCLQNRGFFDIVGMFFLCFCAKLCVCSSVVERCPDKTEVEGPIPSTRTAGEQANFFACV